MAVEFKNILRRLSTNVNILLNGLKYRQWGLYRDLQGNYSENGIDRNIGSLYAKDDVGRVHEFYEALKVDNNIQEKFTEILEYITNLRFKGEWSANEAYNGGETVRYTDPITTIEYLYLTNIDVPAGELPPPENSDWIVMLKGSPDRPVRSLSEDATVGAVPVFSDEEGMTIEDSALVPAMPNGLATLDALGVLFREQLPDIYTSDVTDEDSGVSLDETLQVIFDLLQSYGSATGNIDITPYDITTTPTRLAFTLVDQSTNPDIMFIDESTNSFQILEEGDGFFALRLRYSKSTGQDRIMFYELRNSAGDVLYTVEVPQDRAGDYVVTVNIAVSELPVDTYHFMVYADANNQFDIIDNSAGYLQITGTSSAGDVIAPDEDVSIASISEEGIVTQNPYIDFQYQGGSGLEGEWVHFATVTMERTQGAWCSYRMKQYFSSSENALAGAKPNDVNIVVSRGTTSTSISYADLVISQGDARNFAVSVVSGDEVRLYYKLPSDGCTFLYDIRYARDDDSTLELLETFDVIGSSQPPLSGLSSNTEGFFTSAIYVDGEKVLVPADIADLQDQVNINTSDIASLGNVKTDKVTSLAIAGTNSAGALVEAKEKTYQTEGIALTSSNNLNSVTTPGMYKWQTGSLPSNTPTTNSGSLMVYPTSSSSHAIQISSMMNGSMYIRYTTSSGTSWTAWNEFAKISALSGFVPTSRTVNSKALSSNIVLSASDVSALPSSTRTITTTEINKLSNVPSNTNSELAGKVPTSRTVNNKALTTNITLNASDVSALPSSTRTITTTEINKLSNVPDNTNYELDDKVSTDLYNYFERETLDQRNGDSFYVYNGRYSSRLFIRPDNLFKHGDLSAITAGGIPGSGQWVRFGIIENFGDSFGYTMEAQVIESGNQVNAWFKLSVHNRSVSSGLVINLIDQSRAGVLFGYKVVSTNSYQLYVKATSNNMELRTTVSGNYGTKAMPPNILSTFVSDGTVQSQLTTPKFTAGGGARRYSYSSSAFTRVGNVNAHTSPAHITNDGKFYLRGFMSTGGPFFDTDGLNLALGWTPITSYSWYFFCPSTRDVTATGVRVKITMTSGSSTLTIRAMKSSVDGNVHSLSLDGIVIDMLGGMPINA